MCWVCLLGLPKLERATTLSRRLPAHPVVAAAAWAACVLHLPLNALEQLHAWVCLQVGYSFSKLASGSAVLMLSCLPASWRLAHTAACRGSRAQTHCRWHWPRRRQVGAEQQDAGGVGSLL